VDSRKAVRKSRRLQDNRRRFSLTVEPRMRYASSPFQETVVEQRFRSLRTSGHHLGQFGTLESRGTAQGAFTGEEFLTERPRANGY
jgi:hypothetical protein